MNLKLFQREPTLWIAVIASVISFAGTLGFHLLTPDQAAIWVLIVNALLGILNAVVVRPISPVAFTYFISTAVSLAASYGLNVPPETVMALNGLVVPTLALLTRGQVSPEDTPVTRPSTEAEIEREVS